LRALDVAQGAAVFDWLFEGQSTVYIVLGACAVFLLIVWWQNRWRWCLVALTGVVGLIFVYWLLDRIVVTDREEIRRRVESMAAAVKRKDLNQAMQFFAADFVSPAGRSKETLREFAQKLMDNNDVTEVVVWGFEFEGVPDRKAGTTRASFHFKAWGRAVAEGNGVPYRCDAVFRFSPQHGWQMQSCKLSFLGSNEELPAHF
jgi:hypothetical protein